MQKERNALWKRLNAQQASPAAYAAMIGLEMFIRKASKLEPSLVELVKMRASQINGCAYCIDMHSKDARSEGDDPLSVEIVRLLFNVFRISDERGLRL